MARYPCSSRSGARSLPCATSSPIASIAATKLRSAIADCGKWTIQIVTRTQSIGTFKPEPRRWVVERTFAWLGRNRRLAKDFEATTASAEAGSWPPASVSSSAASQGLEIMYPILGQTLRMTEQ